MIIASTFKRPSLISANVPEQIRARRAYAVDLLRLLLTRNGDYAIALLPMTNSVSLPVHCATGLNVAKDTQFRWLTVTILAVGYGRAGAIGDGSRVPHSGTR